MKSAVTGAYSYTGKYIAGRLLERGDQVITLTNHPNRPDPFAGRIPASPLNFKQPDRLIESLHGIDTVYNTYWVRFDRGINTQSAAVKNTQVLIHAASEANVKRIVHISITNPLLTSSLPYFRGKAAIEEIVKSSGIPYAILRPTVLFGKEDILINNIAYLLRRFPIFAIPGDGTYKLQPVYVDDLAALAIQVSEMKENVLWDAVGPKTYTFEELVRLISRVVGVKPWLVHVPPSLALLAAQGLSLFVKDVLLTPEEVEGLMANLLVSEAAPRCTTSLDEWLFEHRVSIGKVYASELARHYG